MSALYVAYTLPVEDKKARRGLATRQQWRTQEFLTEVRIRQFCVRLTKIIRAAFIVNLLRLVPSLGLLPPLCWVICTLMTFNLTSTALLPTPSLPLGQ